MFVVTPAMASMAKERADKLIAEKKKQIAQYLLEKDEKLKAIGQENCDDTLFVQATQPKVQAMLRDTLFVLFTLLRNHDVES